MRPFSLIVLFAVLLVLGGCTQLPSGIWVPVWQHPSTGFVPEPVELPLVCESRERGDRVITTCH